MRYIVSFLLLCYNLLPPRLRQNITRNWIQAVVKPLQNLNDRFVAFVRNTFYDVSFTGQVVYLEHILNDRYDDTQRRIYIQDGNPLVLPPYLYNKVEQRPLYIFNKSEPEPVEVYLNNKEEYESSVDFVVWVPVSILTSEMTQSITSLVKRYKIAGKRFSVENF